MYRRSLRRLDPERYIVLETTVKMMQKCVTFGHPALPNRI
jgi:hypothetical protein